MFIETDTQALRFEQEITEITESCRTKLGELVRQQQDRWGQDVRCKPAKAGAPVRAGFAPF